MNIVLNQVKISDILSSVFTENNFELLFFIFIAFTIVIYLFIKAIKRVSVNLNKRNALAVNFFSGIGIGCLIFLINVILDRSFNGISGANRTQIILEASSFYYTLWITSVLVILINFTNFITSLGYILATFLAIVILLNKIVLFFPGDDISISQYFPLNVYVLMFLALLTLVHFAAIIRIKFLVKFGKSLRIFALYFVWSLVTVVIGTVILNGNYNDLVRQGLLWILIINFFIFIILIIILLINKYLEFQYNYIEEDKFVKDGVYYENNLLEEVRKRAHENVTNEYGAYCLFKVEDEKRFINIFDEQSALIISDVSQLKNKNKYYLFATRNNELGCYISFNALAEFSRLENNLFIDIKPGRIFNNLPLHKWKNNNIKLSYGILGLHTEDITEMHDLISNNLNKNQFLNTTSYKNTNLISFYSSYIENQFQEKINELYLNKKFEKNLGLNFFKIYKNDVCVGYKLKKNNEFLLSLFDYASPNSDYFLTRHLNYLATMHFKNNANKIKANKLFLYLEPAIFNVEMAYSELFHKLKYLEIKNFELLFIIDYHQYSNKQITNLIKFYELLKKSRACSKVKFAIEDSFLTKDSTLFIKALNIQYFFVSRFIFKNIPNYSVNHPYNKTLSAIVKNIVLPISMIKKGTKKEFLGIDFTEMPEKEIK